ncbi:MAG: cupin domain-containing protein [Puniceicoccaceae bacterium]
MIKPKVKCLISGSQTSGMLARWLEVTAPRESSPMQAHRLQLKLYTVLEGEHIFLVGESRIEAKAGDTVMVGMGEPHACLNAGMRAGKLLFDLLPADDTEVFYERLMAGAYDEEELGAFFSEYGIDLLGPGAKV